MKKVIFPLVLLSLALQSFASFDEWFTNKTLRIDYYHSGNSQDEFYSIDQVKSEPYWGGSHVTLIDTLNYGEYYFKAFDVQSNTLIYSRVIAHCLMNGSLPTRLNKLRAHLPKRW